MMNISRTWAMPNGNTFSIKPIKHFVEKAVGNALLLDQDACIVDPFAKDTKYGTITNDLNPECETMYHMDALEFLRTLDDESADLVLYDPPIQSRKQHSYTKATVRKS